MNELFENMNELFEKIETMTDEEILHDIKKAFDDVCPESRGETLDDILTATFSVMCSLVKCAYDLYIRYPNKRVKHLARHAKKQRTRKKNMRRIGRELMKEAKR